MNLSIDEAWAKNQDETDPLNAFRNQFLIPKGSDGREEAYFCGHSLGLQPVRTRAYLEELMTQWQNKGVRGHFEGEFPWVPYHEFLQKNTGLLTGSLPTEVVSMNTLTANLHMMMVSFYRPTKERYKILIEENAFPSDLYAVETQAKFHGFNPEEALVIVRADQGLIISEEAWKRAIDQHKDSAALLLLPGVQYYTGQAFPIKELTEFASHRGLVVGLDLAHAIGNLPLHLHDWNVDFAVWCHYKYLNSGPGAVGGCFVHERHCKNSELNRFAGWWGHDKDTRFDMKPGFRPVSTVEGWQVSNPPIASLASIRASLDVFAEAGGMEQLREKSINLTRYLEWLVKELLPQHLIQVTSEQAQERGSQLSFRYAGQRRSGKEFVKSLESRGVIVDWREPDTIRIAPVPLYNKFVDVRRCVFAMKDLLDD